MKTMSTLTVNGEIYTVKDPNAVTQETFTAALGDVEAALDELHTYAQSLGGEAS